jgi:hypothetical protein
MSIDSSTVLVSVVVVIISSSLIGEHNELFEAES